MATNQAHLRWKMLEEFDDEVDMQHLVMASPTPKVTALTKDESDDGFESDF